MNNNKQSSSIDFFWNQLICFMWNFKWHPTSYREFMSEYF